MKIDLSRVIGYSRDSLQSRALMRAIMLDLYPGQTLEMNVLLDVYESGIPRKIKNNGKITDTQYAQYIQQIINEYGLQEQYVVNALNQWIDICLGPGAAAQVQKPKGAILPFDLGSYTRSIVHNQKAVSRNPVIGKSSDYEMLNVGNGTFEISRFVGLDKADTIIPTEINGQKVIGIGVDAFKQCRGIRQLIISEGIEYISEGAFADCNNLEKVIFPTSLKQLSNESKSGRYRSSLDRKGAFEGTAIYEVDFPNGISVIGEKAFANCKNLIRILFPDDLRIIESWAFNKCTSLTEITLPSKVEKLGYGAFQSCKRLHNVILNEGLKTIEGRVFDEDPVLTYLVIPTTVVEFGSHIIGSGREKSNKTLGCYPGSRAIEYARLNDLNIKPLMSSVGYQGQSFQEALANIRPINHAPTSKKNNVLTGSKVRPRNYEVSFLENGTVEISRFIGFDQADTIIPNEIDGKKVIGIGADAFKQCKGIQQLIIPEGIEYISEGAFADCSNLKKVILPRSLKQLSVESPSSRYRSSYDRKGAFEGTAIYEIDLPNSIFIIGEKAFANCKNLIRILFPDDLRVIESWAFSHCNSLTEVVLPTKVEVLEYGAFMNCKRLLKVILNEGLKTIKGRVFCDDPALTYLIIPASVEEFGSGIIGLCKGSNNITIGCYPGSKAVEYARLNNLQIVDASKY